MASIHKIKGASKNWLASIRLKGGKRTFRSTGLAATEGNRSAAEALCEQWQRMEDGLGEVGTPGATLNFENSREVAESFITASRKMARGEFTETDARAMLDSLLVAGQENPLSRETIRDTFLAWLKGKTLSKGNRTADRYKTVVKLFLGHIGAKADRPLAALTVRDVESFRDSRMADKLSNKTVSVDLKIIRGVLEGARRQGLILRNPAQGCELPRGKGKERDIFAPQEIKALVGAASGEWKTALLLGYYLGARLEDAVTIDWKQIDMGEGTIHYEQRKTGRVVSAPLHPDLKAHLQVLAEGVYRGYLTPELAGKAGKGDGNLSKHFARVMDKAGVDRSNDTGEGERAFSRKSFHSLRHSFASHLANAGVSDEVRMRLIGHSSKKVHQHYTHLQLEPLPSPPPQ